MAFYYLVFGINCYIGILITHTSCQCDHLQIEWLDPGAYGTGMSISQIQRVLLSRSVTLAGSRTLFHSYMVYGRGYNVP